MSSQAPRVPTLEQDTLPYLGWQLSIYQLATKAVASFGGSLTPNIAPLDVLGAFATAGA